MRKLLSICIPTYNMESLLSRCLDSFIVEKKYMDMLEIIVVNDGSNDNSSAIAHEYAEKYPHNYIVIDKPNGNYGSCINAALKIATGKYFRICDADDRYNKINLQDYIRFLEKTDSDIVFSSFLKLMVDESVVKTVECPNNMNNQSYLIDDINWSDKKMMALRAMHCMATKTQILKDNKYVQTEGISYTDTQFSFYSLLFSDTCSFFNGIIYLYYLGRDGQTMSLESMKKNYFHFYLNADKLIDSYCQILEPLSINRQSVLLNCILSEVQGLVNVFISSFAEVKKQKMVIQSLIKKSEHSFNPCPLEERLIESSRLYKLWKKYHIPTWLLFLMVKVRRTFK